MRVGRHEVLGEIARGGSGIVFRARSPEGADVAVKVLRRRDEATERRFERERRLLDSLGATEGFVPLLESGASPQGPFVVMPFLPGGTLRARLARQGTLPIADALSLAATLARALASAHALGIVHRDVKPENVLFTADGRPLVADLGLAKRFDKAALGASASLSNAGELRGTIGYMAPEQLTDAKSVGPPSDVFALGAVLYECLTGRAIYPGETLLEVVARAEAGTFVAARRFRADVPLRIEELLARCLASDPARRPSAGELASELERQGSPGPGPGSSGGIPRAAFAAALALTVVVPTAWLLGGRPTAPPPRGPGSTRPSDPVAAAEAARALQSALAVVRPETADAEIARAVALAGESAQVDTVRAVVFGRRGDHAAALAAAERAVAAAPGLSRSWLARGKVRFALRDLEGSASDLARAVDLAPGDAEAWVSRARVRFVGGDAVAAIADLDRALDLAPASGDARLLRARARLHLGDLSAAEADLAVARGLIPEETARERHIEAELRFRQGDLVGARLALDRAVALDPGDAQGWTRRSEISLREQRFDDAIEDGTRAAELRPEDASLWTTLAEALVARGEAKGGGSVDFQLAAKTATHALELDPRQALALHVRARANRALGEREAERRDLERFLELAAGHEDAAAARIRIAELSR